VKPPVTARESSRVGFLFVNPSLMTPRHTFTYAASHSILGLSYARLQQVSRS